VTKANKTQATTDSVDDFLASVSPPVRRDDAQILCALMARISGKPPRMWGPSIVGFGVSHYQYESGRSGDILKIGFSPRKAALVLYLSVDLSDPLLTGLGKIATGKSCIYVKRLSDIDLSALESLVRSAWER
jgi:hypothetical protein